MNSFNAKPLRLQNISGTVNFRDIGGYNASGGSTKWRILYRSDALHQLTDEGKNKLRGMGVEKVIDLRDDNERAKFPNELPSTVALTPHPIFPDALSHIDRKLDIQRLTELIFFEHSSALAAAVKLLAETSTPVVVHCTAGKDRTGAVIAATLSAVGVDRDDILNDYEESEKNLAGEWLENHLKQLRELEMEVTPEVLGLISSSPLAVMEKAFKMIDHEYGSMVDYLVKNGLSSSTIDALHRNFVS